MKYTPEQYQNMVMTVQSAIMEAELHNGRILKRLEKEDALLFSLHEKLQKVLLEAVGAIADVEEKLPEVTSYSGPMYTA